MRGFGQLLNTIKLQTLTCKAYQTSRKVQLTYLQVFDMFECDFFNKMRFTLKHRLRRTPDRRARMAELKYQKAHILSEYFSNIAKALHLKFYQMERSASCGKYRILHECSCFIDFIKRVGKEIKCEACRAFYLFFATSLINSIIQEHEC